jgi:predicted metal-dependent enzyme (double-stranded beta helix superfamily)
MNPTLIPPSLTRPDLATLIGDLHHAVHVSDEGQHRIDAVASALQPFLGGPDLLRPDQIVGDPHAYRQHLLHASKDGSFSLVALVWLPGQATAIHDHLSWCVVGIHRGAEYETRYELTPDDELLETGSAVTQVGDVSGLLPPGDIHRVHNVGDDLAVSLHVYGADLTEVGTSIRRRYDQTPVSPLMSAGAGRGASRR